MYIRVKVTPDAKKESITCISDTEFQISVREPARRNLANKRIIELLAENLKIHQSAVRLLTGHRSSTKMFSIEVPLSN